MDARAGTNKTFTGTKGKGMKYVALDTEFSNLKPAIGQMWMLQLYDGKKKILRHNCNGLSQKDLTAEDKKIMEDENICKVIHSSEADMPYCFLQLGVRIRNVWDTRLCEQIIIGLSLGRNSRDPELEAAYSASLKPTHKRYGLRDLDKGVRTQFIDRPLGTPFTKEEIEYAMEDVLDLLKLQKAQEFILTRDGLLELALMENKCAEKVAMMKAIGIGFDKQRWIQIAKRNNSEFEKRIAKLPSEVRNWNSEKQVKAYFLKKGIMIPSYKDLDEILVTSGNQTLKDFIEARSLHKAVTSYGLNWLTEGHIDPDNRVRPSVTQIINTGRMSMSDPNLQQLPAKGNHRSAFVPATGKVFVIGDFSGQEIGIMAAASGEDIWIDALLRGDDIHGLTASLLYASEWEAGRERGCKFPSKCKCRVHLALRQNAKVLNFMLAYGGGPLKFSQSTGIPELESRVIVKKYKRVIPKLTKWLEKNGQDAVLTGESFSADPYRRRRVLMGEEEWQVVNQGKNNPVQAAGANMLKLAMVSIPDKFPIVLVIHDEIVLEVPTKLAKEACRMLKKVMEDSADYITGIKGIIKVEPRVANDLTKD